MRSNKAFPLEGPCLAVGNGEELGRLAFHCDFGKIGNLAVLIAANVLKGINPTDIPSRETFGRSVDVA